MSADTDAGGVPSTDPSVMREQTVIALLVTCFTGYAMIYSGVGKRLLRTGTRGRCPRCGRLRIVCTCGS